MIPNQRKCSVFGIGKPRPTKNTKYFFVDILISKSMTFILEFETICYLLSSFVTVVVFFEAKISFPLVAEMDSSREGKSTYYVSPSKLTTAILRSKANLKRPLTEGQ